MRALVVAALFACSAVVPAVAASEVVMVSDPATLTGCERLGEVTSSSMMGGVLTGAGYKRALAKLKERAGSLGGTHLHLLNGNSNYAGSNFLGVAYRCPAKPSGSGPAQQGGE